MSHIVTIQTQVLDATAVALACERLGLPPPQNRRVQLYNEWAEGLAIELPGWKYPVVCNLGTGNVKYDNYGGAWGDQRALHGLLQAYTLEKARIEARRQGHSVTEQPLPDGSIKLTIHLAGGVA